MPPATTDAIVRFFGSVATSSAQSINVASRLGSGGPVTGCNGSNAIARGVAGSVELGSPSMNDGGASSVAPSNCELWMSVWLPFGSLNASDVTAAWGGWGAGGAAVNECICREKSPRIAERGEPCAIT